MKKVFGLLFTITVLNIGCGDGDDNENSPGTQTGECETVSDCGEGYACLSAGVKSICTPICSGSMDECGAETSCGGVGMLSVNVCKPEQSEAEAKDPEQQPSLPCKSDADCEILQAGTICATWKGHSDCTIPCSNESDCSLPVDFGVSIDFMACIDDEAEARTACLPDEKCIENMMNCISGGYMGDTDTAFLETTE